MTTKASILRELQDYYQVDIDGTKATRYLRLLGDVNPAVLQAAADKWQRESPHHYRFPEVKDLLDIIEHDDSVKWLQSEMEPDTVWWLECQGTEYDGCPTEGTYQPKEFELSSRKERSNHEL